MKSIRNLFTPSDFLKFSVGKIVVKGLNRDTREMIVDRAQKILDEYLDLHGTKVYSDSNGFKRSQYTCIHYHGPEPSFKESAILVDIQPIEKECEHEPQRINVSWNFTEGRYDEAFPIHHYGGFKCYKCGAKLKPKGGWEAVDE